MLKKGLCGVDLRHQVAVIGILYSALSIFGVIFGFVLLESPEQFTSKLQTVRTEQELAQDAAAAGGRWDEALAGLSSTTEVNKDENVGVKKYDSLEAVAINITDMSPSSSPNLDETMGQELDRAATAVSGIVPDSAAVDGTGLSRAATVPPELLDQALKSNDDISVMKYKTADADQEVAGADNEKSEDTSLSENISRPPTLSENTRHYYQLIRYLQNEGVEAIIACLIKLVCSILLIAGARTMRPWFLVPWMVEELVEMVGSFMQLTVTAARSGQWSLGGLAMLSVIYVAGGYIVYSVISYHRLLLRMSKQSQEVISSVCQGGFQSGLNYQRLEEDCWQSTLSVEYRDRARDAGFVREAKVGMDDNDEHVLYVQ